MKTWYSIVNKADAPAAEIDIFDEIGLWGVTAKDFATSLKSIPSDREITLRINSPGGSVFDGAAIYNLLAERRDKITAKVIGLAASMASVVMLAGRRVLAAENATVMIHNPAGGAWGESEEMRKMADLLDKLKGQLVAAYVRKTGKTEKEIAAAMDETTWFTAAEAREFGLVDEITEAVQATATFDLSRFGALPKNISGGRPASTNQPNANTQMKKLLQALVDAKLIASADVNEDTAVAQFVAAFAGITSSVTDATAQVTDLTAKLTDATKKLEASAKATAEGAVAAAVQSGRIKDDADLRAKWIAAYIRDEAGTKALLESLPEAKAPRGVAPVATGKTTPGETPENRPSTESVWAKQFTK